MVTFIGSQAGLKLGERQLQVFLERWGERQGRVARLVEPSGIREPGVLIRRNSGPQQQLSRVGGDATSELIVAPPECIRGKVAARADRDGRQTQQQGQRGREVEEMPAHGRVVYVKRAGGCGWLSRAMPPRPPRPPRRG